MDAGSPDAWVFTGPAGGPLRYRNWHSRVWQAACRAAGLDDLEFHSLRHAAASTMMNGGVDPRTAQVRLGHSDPRLTIGVYSKASPESDRAAAELMGTVFLGPDAGEDDDAGDEGDDGTGCAMDVP